MHVATICTCYQPRHTEQLVDFIGVAWNYGVESMDACLRLMVHIPFAQKLGRVRLDPSCCHAALLWFGCVCCHVRCKQKHSASVEA